VTGLLSLREIRRDYPIGNQVVEALRGIDLDVARGEFISLMGPSGSGKSTLLNILGCLDRPTAGSYRFEGEEVAGFSAAQQAKLRRHRIGFVFQSFHLVARLTAAENVELPLIFAGAGDRPARVAAALEAVGLTDRAHHRPDQLSGGQRQRTAIARAIVMEPELILADEPTGNLDTRTGDEILALLMSLHARGRTLVVVTHNADICARAQRVIRLVDGRIV
jgi:putative ABC transport system ATP-binding protein